MVESQVAETQQQHVATAGRKRKLMAQQNLENTLPDNEFERQRFERIERNRQIMAEMGVQQAAAEMKQAMQKSKKQKSMLKPVPAPSRRSSRLALQPVEAAMAEAEEPSDKPDASTLLTQEEYFKLLGDELPSSSFESDGAFKGWVSEEVCSLYGIASSAGDAWESNGGGKFTRKPDMAQVPSHIRAKGWSDAKAFAATMLKKNPNTYFYRHVAPHEQQAQGEWTEEEHNLFLQTARKHGVGDKWGLFATYIPQRVGYQCSAYYRDVMIAQGLILDKRFRMTPSGRAVFVGV